MTIPFKKISHEEALLLQNSEKTASTFFIGESLHMMFRKL